MEDIYRANNPRPFGYVKHDTEDIESLTDRSVDHMQNIPHTSHDEDRTPTPTLPQFQYDDEYSSDENLTLQIDELEDNRQENILKIDFMNQIIIGLKKDIHSISRLIIKLEKSEHPVIVESLSKEAEKLYLQYGSAWKPFFIQANCENKHNKTLHQKKFNELVNFYDCMAEEYSITSVTECNNLLYLRHYNIQETIEQPPPRRSWLIRCSQLNLEEEIEQLKQSSIQNLIVKLTSHISFPVSSTFLHLNLNLQNTPASSSLIWFQNCNQKACHVYLIETSFGASKTGTTTLTLLLKPLSKHGLVLFTLPMPPSRYAKNCRLTNKSGGYNNA